jgi:phosphoribosylformimino-5-aminoimidazole carboxamide ribonucleotide (ProFAR) isomerase
MMAGMLQSRDGIKARIAVLKQKQLEMEQQFTRKSAARLDVSDLEAALIALSAEISVLESMLSH